MNRLVAIYALVSGLSYLVGAAALAEDSLSEHQLEANAGADAANPTAVVNFQDLRYRYFDLSDGADVHSYETEGSLMLHPRLKVTNELRAVSTDVLGRRETNFQELKLKAIFLTDGTPFGIKAKYAVGAEWLKDLGQTSKGTGTGADLISPLVGIGWIPTEVDFVVTLVQYFHSYDTDDNRRNQRQTGPRLIWIRKLPSIGGWFKADYRALIDHQNGDDFTSTFELQLGKMFNPRVGIYAEALIGDDVLDTDAFDMGAGVGLRFMY